MECWENEGGNLGLVLRPCPVCGYSEDWLDPQDRELWPEGIPHLECLIRVAMGDIWGEQGR